DPEVKAAAPAAPSFAPRIALDELQQLQYLSRDEYGYVFRAQWRQLQVVVKVPISSQQQQDLISEMEEMRKYLRLPPHPHVVPLLGLCAKFRCLLPPE